MSQGNQEVNLNELSYDWNKLELADVALDYLQQANQQGLEGSPLANKSLELVLKDIGFRDPAILRTITDKQVIPLTIKNQLDFYHEGLSQQKVGDRLEYYHEGIAKYLGDDAEKVKEKLAPFLDMKTKDIEQKVTDAEHIFDGKKKGVSGISDEDVKNAKKEIEKYSDVQSTLEMLKQQRKSQLRMRVEDAFYKDRFKEIYLSEPEGNQTP